MICTQCGYMQADDQIPCRRCGHFSGRSTQRPVAGSILDFPGGVNRPGNGRPPAGRVSLEVHTPANVPAWRAELSARVRQIKARRSMEAELEAAMQEHQKSSPTPDIPVMMVTAEPEEFHVEDISAASPEEPVADERNENPIVRAMLDRVRRASESSRSLDAPPKAATLPNRSVKTNPMIVTTATAPAAVTAPLTSPVAREAAAAQVAPAPEVFPDLQEAPVAVPTPEVLEAPLESTAQVTMLSQSDIQGFPDLFEELDEIIEHIEERPEITERLRAAAIDFGTIVLSNIPLWAAVEFIGGNFGDLRVQMILLTATIMIAGMYLFGTTAVSGQTFGMIYGRIRIVDVHTLRRPTVLQALLRTVGYMVSFATLMLGFVWIIFDKHQRGVHEHISGTQVVRILESR